MSLPDQAGRPSHITDPHFQDVLEVWGAEALKEAGYFQLPPSTASLDPEQATWPLCTPTHLLRHPPQNIIPVVLLSTGAMNPVHQGHLGTLDQAREQLESQGLYVAGGYLMPDHQDYVSRKLGEAALDASTRIEIARLACEHHGWICDPWGALWANGEVNFTDAARRLQAYLRLHWHPLTEVCNVVGADNAGFARAFVKRGRCVIVARAGARKHKELVSDPAMQEALMERVVILEKPWEYWDYSSSRVRSGDLPLIPEAMQLQTRATQGWYALRDDLEWACEAWLGKLRPGALQQFRETLTNAISQATGLEVRHIMVAPQQQIIDQYPDAISLDVVTQHPHTLHLSRLFHVGSSQHHSSQLIPRPGHADIHDQINELIPQLGRHTQIIDDDIASGTTMQLLSDLLGRHNIYPGKRLSLLKLTTPDNPVDICDMRDFVLGAREAGLSVLLPSGRVARASYLLPWVNLNWRTSIRPQRIPQLSHDLWQANLELFRNSGLRVRDSWPACQTLLLDEGYSPEDPIEGICQNYLTHHPTTTVIGGAKAISQTNP